MSGGLKLQHDANIINGATMCNFPDLSRRKYDQQNQQKMVEIVKTNSFFIQIP